MRHSRTRLIYTKIRYVFLVQFCLPGGRGTHGLPTYPIQINKYIQISPYTNQIVTPIPTHNTILQDVKPDGTDATSIKIIILVCTMTVTLLIPKITQTV